VEYVTILVEEQDGVATITLNRPKSLNAINDQMLRELTHAFQWTQDTPSVRAVLLRAEGKGFCSGGDVMDMMSKKAELAHNFENDTAEFNAMAEKLLTLDKVVVCAVQGIAAGAGFNLVLGSDFAFAAENATFTQVFTHIGLIPDAGGCYTLPRLVGLKKAKELMLTHRSITAEEAMALGLIDRVVPSETLTEEAMNCARQFAQGPTRAYAGIKKILRHTFDASLEETLRSEAQYQAMLSVSEDFGEGLAAFREKRKAQFNGK